MIAELIKANRSCRRFYEDQAVDLKTLEALVDLARLSASGANLQPLKYILSCRPALNEEIFRCLGWTAYLKDWSGPQRGERPAA
jgi:nitroreductase